MTQTNMGTAVVTGASSGIGALYADRLARRGYNLILVARNRQRLDTLARDLADKTGRTVEVIAADLNNRADLARVEQALRTDSSITALINNAGVGSATPLLAANPEDMQAMIDLNVTSLVRLTYAAVPGMVARGKGTIINISSIAAITPEVLNGVYSGSKAFVLAFSQSLHHELKDKNIRVQVVAPGATATNFWEAAGVAIEQLPQEWVMKTEEMVDAALAGLDQGELVTIPALPDIADWQAYEAARQKMMPNLSRTHAAERYRTKAVA